MSKSKRRRYRQARKAQRQEKAKRDEQRMAEEIKTLAIIKVFTTDKGEMEAVVYCPPRLNPWTPDKALTRHAVMAWNLPDDLVLFISDRAKDQSLRAFNQLIINTIPNQTAVLDCIEWCLANNRHRFVIDTNMTARPASETDLLTLRRARAHGTSAPTYTPSRTPAATPPLQLGMGEEAGRYGYGYGMD